MQEEKSTIKALKLKTAACLIVFIGSMLFALPTIVSINGVGALFSWDRLTFPEFIKSVAYGSVDDVRSLYYEAPESKTTLNLDVSMLDLRYFENLLSEARSQKMLTKKLRIGYQPIFILMVRLTLLSSGCVEIYLAIIQVKKYLLGSRFKEKNFGAIGKTLI